MTKKDLRIKSAAAESTKMTYPHIRGFLDQTERTHFGVFLEAGIVGEPAFHSCPVCQILR